MDTVTAISERRLEALPEPLRAPAATKMLTVTATYLLSEEGRKASLLDGGDGKAVQQLSLQVPANRLHLVSVDAHGVARLKLRPRYQLDGDNGIVGLTRLPPMTSRLMSRSCSERRRVTISSKARTGPSVIRRR
jgi:hypothetical protein